jgi:transposase-like protein
MKSDPLFSEIDEWVDKLISTWVSKRPKPIVSEIENNMMLYMKDKGAHCPFCGHTGMERHPVDETSSQQGRLVQKRTCWQCGKAWVIEYDMARVDFASKKYDKLGEVNKKCKTERETIINRILRQARRLDW